MKPDSKTIAAKIPVFFALVFGLFLGLCIWKFGDPVILDHKIVTPETVSDYWNDAWPPHWSHWIWPPLAAWGALLIFQGGIAVVRGRPLAAGASKPAGSPISKSATGARTGRSAGSETRDRADLKVRATVTGFFPKWLWILPLAWLGWQFVSSTQTVDADLTSATLWQFGGCVACYFLGALLLNRERLGRLLLIGTLAALTFCLIRAVDQRVFEYPQDYQDLVEGERVGWTNFPPNVVTEMKTEGIVITTNGMEVANPIIVMKFARGRVCGTLVYPNALAEIILLLWPVSLALAFGATKNLRPGVRLAAITVTILLGGAAFFWTGSKLGWLIGVGLAGVVLLRLDWPRKLKLIAMGAVLVVGLGVFAARFYQYFEAGATSAGARFDYWRAALETTAERPVFGTGPGTFQRPYARLKSPDSEMARLAHNDYLEQFSDSGIVGGVIYCAWIFAALAIAGKGLWRSGDGFSFAIWLGLLGWFTQGVGEFGLFVPALAWTAFTLLGHLIGRQSFEVTL